MLGLALAVNQEQLIFLVVRNNLIETAESLKEGWKNGKNSLKTSGKHSEMRREQMFFFLVLTSSFFLPSFPRA